MTKVYAPECPPESPEWDAISFEYLGDDEWMAWITYKGNKDQVIFMCPEDADDDMLEEDVYIFWLEFLAGDDEMNY